MGADPAERRRALVALSALLLAMLLGHLNMSTPRSLSETGRRSTS